MLTNILASVGIGVGIFIAMFIILALMSRSTISYVNGQVCMQGKYINECRMFILTMITTIICITAYFVFKGSPVIKAIGLTTIIVILADIILFCIVETIAGDNSEDEPLSGAIIGLLINLIAFSVFAVLIINHFNLI